MCLAHARPWVFSAALVEELNTLYKDGMSVSWEVGEEVRIKCALLLITADDPAVRKLLAYVA